MGHALEFAYEMKECASLSDYFSLERLFALWSYDRKIHQRNELPLVSILLPLYKTKKEHLQECIQSILNQTYNHWELLILDDSPEDKSAIQVIKKFNDPRIYYKKNERNVGIANTRNKLMQDARGKYLAVMDHDDIMLPERLERQVMYMDLNPTVGILGSAYKRFGSKSGIISHSRDSNDIKAGLFFKCTMHHPSIMIRADLIRQYNILYNSNYISANDRCLYIDMMPYTEFHNFPLVLMNYRVHSKMTSKEKREIIVQEQKKLRKVLLKKMGVEFTNDQWSILNDYVLTGRCRIKSKTILKNIETILCCLDSANLKCGYFPKESFSKLCGIYLVKRCLNAALWGRFSSSDLLRTTKVSFKEVKIPMLLKVLNFLLPKKEGK